MKNPINLLESKQYTNRQSRNITQIANRFAKVLAMIARIPLEGIALCEDVSTTKNGSDCKIFRNAEIEESGVMGIPPRNKCPGYSGYPSTAELHVENRHATPGPSRPRTGTMAKYPRSPQNQTS